MSDSSTPSSKDTSASSSSDISCSIVTSSCDSSDSSSSICSSFIEASSSESKSISESSVISSPSVPSSSVMPSVSSEKSSAYIMLVELIEVILSTNVINHAYILFLIVPLPFKNACDKINRRHSTLLNCYFDFYCLLSRFDCNCNFSFLLSCYNTFGIDSCYLVIGAFKSNFFH